MLRKLRSTAGCTYGEECRYLGPVPLQLGLQVARVEGDGDDALVAVPPVQLVRKHHCSLWYGGFISDALALCKPRRVILTNLLCAYSFIEPALRRFGLSRYRSKSRPDAMLCAPDDVFTTRTFPSGDVSADAMRSGSSSFVR